MLLPLAVFTADNEHIFTVTLDLSVQACKNAILSLANVARYMLHAVQSQSSACSLLPELLLQLLFLKLCLHYISISANYVINKKRKETSNKNILTKMEEI